MAVFSQLILQRSFEDKIISQTDTSNSEFQKDTYGTSSDLITTLVKLVAIILYLTDKETDHQKFSELLKALKWLWIN